MYTAKLAGLRDYAGVSLSTEPRRTDLVCAAAVCAVPIIAQNLAHNTVMALQQGSAHCAIGSAAGRRRCQPFSNTSEATVAMYLL